MCISGQAFVLAQAVELTEGCINPLLFSTSALAHLKSTVHSGVNYIKFNSVYVCARVCGESHLFSTRHQKYINQLVLGDKHTQHTIVFHMGLPGFKVAAVH